MSDGVQYYKSENSIGWRIDNDGMLRCTTNVLKSCVMDYGKQELNNNVPNHLKNRDVLRLYVPPDELEKETAISSLEGKPVSVDHIWQKSGDVVSVGNVAGTPYYDSSSGMLKADILITDKKAQERITKYGLKNKLIEQSAAYTNKIDWTSGISPDGTAYDGVQRDLNYNHIALLEKGKGRAGEDVRILNQGEKTMSDFTGLIIEGSTIRIMNEDISKMENVLSTLQNRYKKDKEDMENKCDSKMKKSKNDMDEMEEDLNNEKKEHEKTKGEKESLQNRINNELSPEALEAKLTEISNERETATAILNSISSDESTIAEVSGKMGHELRLSCVNAYRTQNSMDLVNKDAKETYVQGLFEGLKGFSVQKEAVSGGRIVQTMNQKGGTQRSKDPTERLRENQLRKQAALKKHRTGE